MMTIGEQANLAATYKKMPKLKLVGQALENFLLAEQLNAANQKQGEKINRLIDALREIVDSESAQSIQSYGLGDIARVALEWQRTGNA